MRSNVVGTLNLTDCCFQAGVHCTVFATGCIYHYDSDHPVGGPAFTEQDEPNFRGSFYSLTKACLETVGLSRDASPSAMFLIYVAGYETLCQLPHITPPHARQQ